MNDECIICGAPLEYLARDEEMECAICHKKEMSKTRCVKGHYVCDECHTKGIDVIYDICMHSRSKDPIEIIREMMDAPFCHMHGPEHHVMVGAALLTAYHNAGGQLGMSDKRGSEPAMSANPRVEGDPDKQPANPRPEEDSDALNRALHEMISRGRQVPGGVCGFWGACGAGISTGMYVSIITGSSPLAEQAWGLSNQMTSEALGEIAKTGGPRCCKRDSYTAIRAAVNFTKEHFGVEMEYAKPVCTHVSMNNQCIGARCPYGPGNHRSR